MSSDEIELVVFKASDLPMPSPDYFERRDRAEALKAAAQQLDVPPQYEAGNPVHCRGEKLSLSIYWQGRQWAVTAYGVECRDGTYAIDKKWIWEREHQHGWVMHMFGKTWTDLEDFAEALRIARRRWRQYRKPNEGSSTDPPAGFHHPSSGLPPDLPPPPPIERWRWWKHLYLSVL